MGGRARCWTACLAAVFLSATASATLRWDELPPLPDPAGVAGPFVGVHGDALMVAGGANFPEPRWETQKVFHDRVHVLLRETAGGKTAYRWVEGPRLARPLAYGVCVSTPRGVVCAGGNDAEQVYADAFLLAWDAAKKTVVTTSLPPLPEPRTNAATAVLGDAVYVAGGTTGLGLETADTAFLRLDLSRPEAGWEVLPPWPGPSRALAIAAAQNNGVDDCLYLCSGRRVNAAGETEFLADLYEFNPARHRAGGEAWRRRAAAPRCVMAGTAAPVGQSHLFVLSGADEALFFQADTLKEAHPGFPKEAFAYHTITDTWVSAGETPANQVTTTAVRWGLDAAKDPVIIASGELRPRLRTPRVWAVTPVPGGTRFGAADFTVLFLYLAAMIGVGVFFSFRNRTADRTSPKK